MSSAHTDLLQDNLPNHIAVVMDGNGRWAQKRGLPRTEGHRRGENVLNDIVRACLDLGVPYLSTYAFSTENWRRPQSEVSFLLGFSRRILRKRRDELHELGVRIQWSGARERLWPSVIEELDTAVALTAENTRMTLALCINYGGRTELRDAARSLAQRVQAGELRPDDISEDLIAEHLYTPDMPDVDLFLRTSGEQRISNFLLWQSAYAEMVFCPTLFPDFTRDDFLAAVQEYQRRHRRFGGSS